MGIHFCSQRRRRSESIVLHHKSPQNEELRVDGASVGRSIMKEEACVFRGTTAPEWRGKWGEEGGSIVERAAAAAAAAAAVEYPRYTHHCNCIIFFL